MFGDVLMVVVVRSFGDKATDFVVQFIKLMGYSVVDSATEVDEKAPDEKAPDEKESTDNLRGDADEEKLKEIKSNFYLLTNAMQNPEVVCTI